MTGPIPSVATARRIALYGTAWLVAMTLLALLISPRVLDQDEPTTAPATCAECETEDDCNRLCGVGPCTAPGQTGCWMPEGLTR